MNNIISQLRVGVKVKTHSHFLRHYPNAFSGSEAVSWMVENIFTQTHEEAVALGQLLLNHGALCHVYDQSAPFSNDHHLYRFLDAEAYATNKSGLLGLRHEPASPSELRWCCLRKRDFYWFEKPHSTRHLGHVFLQDILLSIGFPEWPSTGSPLLFQFEVRTQDKVLMLAANSREDMRSWVELFNPFTQEAENEKIEQAERMLEMAAEELIARSPLLCDMMMDQEDASQRRQRTELCGAGMKNLSGAAGLLTPCWPENKRKSWDDERAATTSSKTSRRNPQAVLALHRRSRSWSQQHGVWQA